MIIDIAYSDNGVEIQNDWPLDYSLSFWITVIFVNIAHLPLAVGCELLVNLNHNNNRSVYKEVIYLFFLIGELTCSE